MAIYFNQLQTNLVIVTQEEHMQSTCIAAFLRIQWHRQLQLTRVSRTIQFRGKTVKYKTLKPAPRLIKVEFMYYETD